MKYCPSDDGSALCSLLDGHAGRCDFTRPRPDLEGKMLEQWEVWPRAAIEVEIPPPPSEPLPGPSVALDLDTPPVSDADAFAAAVLLHDASERWWHEHHHSPGILAWADLSTARQQAYLAMARCLLTYERMMAGPQVVDGLRRRIEQAEAECREALSELSELRAQCREALSERRALTAGKK